MSVIKKAVQPKYEAAKVEKRVSAKDRDEAAKKAGYASAAAQKAGEKPVSKKSE